MFDWIAQLRVLAQRDGDEWVNILFIVAVAVFWAIGGLIKAAGGRKNAPQNRPRPVDAQGKGTWQQRLARKAEEIKQAADERIRTLQERAESLSSTPEAPGRDRSAQGRVTVRSRRGGESVLVYERHDPRKAAEEKRRRAAAQAAQAQQAAESRRRAHLAPKPPQVTPIHGSLPDALSAMGQRPEPLGLDESLPEAAPQAGYAASSLIDHTDADALKRAILHCEILGKPLSLRDPFPSASDF
jgi:hypothetical protein